VRETVTRDDCSVNSDTIMNMKMCDTKNIVYFLINWLVQ
jgi:hypothetical protein